MTNREHDKKYYINIKNHLLELEEFVSHPVDRSALIDVKFTQEVRNNNIAIRTCKIKKSKVPFEYKETNSFSAFIESLYMQNKSAAFVWTSWVDSCGLYKIDSIRDFNYKFKFNINNDGIIALTTTDFRNKLLFDFSYNDSGCEELEIEVSGFDWSSDSIEMI